MIHGLGWTEVYDGGSPEAEREIFLLLAEEMRQVQEANRQKAGTPHPSRTLHAKAVASVTNAFLAIDQLLAPEFAVSYFQPGAILAASLRFSNASGVAQHDGAPDMRGVAVRVDSPGNAAHDFLMTSFPVSHARNARQFVDFAMIAAGDCETLLPRLVKKFGTEEAQRMGANIRQGVRHCPSFALESFWSRGAILWGGVPVRYQLRPDPGADSSREDPLDGPDGLHLELAKRLKKAPIRFRLALQRFADEERTPIEDGAVEWSEEVTPPIDIATLVIPQQDLLDNTAVARAKTVEQMAFNPWNAPEEFRPLGNLNRARRIVYSKSAERWQIGHSRQGISFTGREP